MSENAEEPVSAASAAVEAEEEFDLSKAEQFLDELERESGQSRKDPRRGFSPAIQQMLDHPVLTREEERDLLQRMVEHWDRRAYERLSACNARLVAKIARRYASHLQHLTLDELFQEGWFGLHTALMKFDISRGYRFSTYAVWQIRARIQRLIADRDREVRVPTHQLERGSRIKTVEREIAARSGRTAEDGEIAEATGLSLQQVQLAATVLARRAVSMDDLVPGTDDLRIGDTIAAPETASGPRDLRSNRDFLRTFAPLPPHLRECVILRANGWTMQQIGQRFGLTRQRVEQWLNKEARALIANSEQSGFPIDTRGWSYLEGVVAYALGAVKGERWDDWDLVRNRLVATEEWCPGADGLDKLVRHGIITPMQSAIAREFWMANGRPNGRAEFEAQTARLYRSKSYRKGMLTVAEVAWRAKQVELGWIKIAPPEEDAESAKQSADDPKQPESRPTARKSERFQPWPDKRLPVAENLNFTVPYRYLFNAMVSCAKKACEGLVLRDPLRFLCIWCGLSGSDARDVLCRFRKAGLIRSAPDFPMVRFKKRNCPLEGSVSVERAVRMPLPDGADPDDPGAVHGLSCLTPRQAMVLIEQIIRDLPPGKRADALGYARGLRNWADGIVDYPHKAHLKSEAYVICWRIEDLLHAVLQERRRIKGPEARAQSV